MFFTTMVISTLITISSHSWMGMWIGLEINLLSITPLLSSSNNSNSAEATIKYFITQAMASNILLMSIILMTTLGEQSPPSLSTLWVTTQSALFMKMGAAPFHVWFPEVMSGLSWKNCLLMLTWQKIAPMVILMNIIKQSTFTTAIVVLSALIGTILGINQTSLRKIMAYSSINHIGWMTAAMTSAQFVWTMYFLIYSTISINILLILDSFKINSISQIAEILDNSKFTSLIYSLNFFSLGGLPPFLGFLPKWLTIQYLTQENNAALAIFLSVITLVAMFYYLRIGFSSMMMTASKSPSPSPKMKFIVMMSNSWSLVGLLACCSVLNMS
uniref:NADH-ubiquinone oxidoreductase chain 2 n=1 Tax=Clytra quadripunctata TaxID=1425548 RepID=A0A3G1GRA7_9CUCU|nr:NADH dehydrogenase subunit 2 [Clytra quadripunctata]